MANRSDRRHIIIQMESSSQAASIHDSTGDINEVDEDAAVEAENGQADNMADRGEIRGEDLRNLHELVIKLRGILPFTLILLLKFLFDDFWLVVCVFGGYIAFITADASLVQQAEQRSYSRATLKETGIILLCFSTYLALFWFLYPSLLSEVIFMQWSLQEITFFSTISFVFLKDVCAKHLTVFLKLCITFFPEKLLSRKRRCRIFQLLECSSIFYRSILPITQWSSYFLADPQSYIRNYIVVCLYYVCKLCELLHKFKPCWRTLWSLNSLSTYAEKPSETDLLVASSCSICFDKFRQPVKLPCSHIFCEECVDTWLEKEKTCPLCRAIVIVDNVEWQSGATSKMLKLY